MYGQSWGSTSDDEDDERSSLAPAPASDEMDASDIKPPRRKSTPIEKLRKFLSPEKDTKDINFEYYGRLCTPEFSDQPLIFSSEENILYGRAEYCKKPEDRKELLQLAAKKGHLAFFKLCEVSNTDLIDDEFLKDLARIALENQKDEIIDYLNAKYGERLNICNSNSSKIKLEL